MARDELGEVRLCDEGESDSCNNTEINNFFNDDNSSSHLRSQVHSNEYASSQL